MGSGWSSNITITQDASRLSVEYVFFARGDMQPPLKFIYALDGSETKNSVMMGRGVQVQTSKTAWDGGRLVITTVHTFAHPETGQPMTTEVKQTLSLEASSLVLETARSGVLGGPPRLRGPSTGNTRVVGKQLFMLRRNIRIRRIRRYMRKALCCRSEIRDDLVHCALSPGIRVLDVRFLLGI